MGNNFKLDYALSREQKNKAGGKMYIQDKVGEYADEVFTRMDNGGHMYFCGLKGATTSLCVRRATYWCPELKADDPAKKGICSNFLRDSKPGDEVKLTGPSGKVMLIPESTPNADLIMVATVSGIAPYRSFIRRLFVEKTPFAADHKGLDRQELPRQLQARLR